MRVLLSVAVAREVFCRGEHAIVLNSTDERPAHSCDELRIFTEGTRGDYRILWIVVDVEHGRERHVDAERTPLERGDAAHLVSERRVA